MCVMISFVALTLRIKENNDQVNEMTLRDFCGEGWKRISKAIFLLNLTNSKAQQLVTLALFWRKWINKTIEDVFLQSWQYSQGIMHLTTL